MKHQDIISKMTLEQKADIVAGLDYWHTKGYDELGLPSLMLTDGPHGLRKQNTDKKTKKGVGLGNSIPTTCMPPACTSSCSWDEDLLRREGEALGEECLQEEVSTILGPGTNIKRSPTGGRNFEYFSEDPLLAGKMASNLIQGCQSKGVGNSLKHYAVNSQEAFRMVINEVIDERSMRELYLTAFEIAVKESQPWTVMGSYNKVNGEYASQDKWLLLDVLRDEWGFDGMLVTDWGSNVDRLTGVVNGEDLQMPTSGKLNTKLIIEAVNSGKLDEKDLDARVDNVVDWILKGKETLEKNKGYKYDEEAHHAIAREVAEGSMQLLKNDGAILPLKAGQKVAVIGEMAKSPRFQGAGSSVINPTKLDNAYDKLVEAGVDVTYAEGYVKGKDEVDDALLNEAVENAKNADVALVFVGLTEEFEGEGYDRENIEIPNCHNALVDAVVKANPNTVVVLAGGSVVHMPWAGEIKGLLNSGLGGQAGGAAVANILTGKVNPSGKTSETYPLEYSDNPTFGNFPGEPVISEHKESVYLGYRYYDSAKKDVLFPFGYGLSYTTFEYSDLKLSSKDIKDTDTVTVSFKIKNTGKVDGAEIAEVYVKDVDSTIYRPEKELKGFKKVFLKAGEEKEVSVDLSKRAFAFYNINIHDWYVESGEFEILVGASSRDIKLSDTINVTSTVKAEVPDYRKTAPTYYNNVAGIQSISDDEWGALYLDKNNYYIANGRVDGTKLPDRERDPNAKIDIYCNLYDARNTKWGKKLNKFINKIMKKFGSAENGDGQMLAAMATQIPVRNFVQMSMGAFSPKQAEGLLKMLNDDESSFAGFNMIFWRLGGTLAKLPHLLKSI